MLTVEENLLVSAPRRAIQPAFEMFPELQRLAGRRAGLLSGGEQQMLIIARAVLTQPRVLLLDEISLGLSPALVGRLLPEARALAEAGITVVMVEQFAQQALSLGDRVYLLDKGEIAFEGSCQTLLDDPGLLHAAYLRVERDRDAHELIT